MCFVIFLLQEQGGHKSHTYELFAQEKIVIQLWKLSFTMSDEFRTVWFLVCFSRWLSVQSVLYFTLQLWFSNPLVNSDAVCAVLDDIVVIYISYCYQQLHLFSIMWCT